jgi:hypothetical protein
VQVEVGRDGDKLRCLKHEGEPARFASRNGQKNGKGTNGQANGKAGPGARRVGAKTRGSRTSAKANGGPRAKTSNRRGA